MIGDGLFRTQLNAIEVILKAMSMLEERQPSPNKGLGAAHFKGMNYREVYEESVREFAYDFRLSDQSLLLFMKSGNNGHDGSLNYCYLECPVKVCDYREFVGNTIGLSIMDEDFDDEVDEWGDEMRSDYEQYVSSLVSKSSVTPLRYDYKATDYRPGVHPASHVHFGHDNEIRVGTKRVMKPLSFMLFVLRLTTLKIGSNSVKTMTCLSMFGMSVMTSILLRTTIGQPKTNTKFTCTRVCTNFKKIGCSCQRNIYPSPSPTTISTLKCFDLIVQFQTKNFLRPGRQRHSRWGSGIAGERLKQAKTTSDLD